METKIRKQGFEPATEPRDPNVCDIKKIEPLPKVTSPSPSTFNPKNIERNRRELNLILELKSIWAHSKIPQKHIDFLQIRARMLTRDIAPPDSPAGKRFEKSSSAGGRGQTEGDFKRTKPKNIVLSEEERANNAAIQKVKLQQKKKVQGAKGAKGPVKSNAADPSQRIDWITKRTVVKGVDDHPFPSSKPNKKTPREPR